MGFEPHNPSEYASGWSKIFVRFVDVAIFMLGCVLRQRVYAVQTSNRNSASDSR